MAASDLEGDAIRQYRLRTIEIVRFANTGTLCQSDAPANHLDRNPGLLSDSDVSPWADAVDGEWRLNHGGRVAPLVFAGRIETTMIATYSSFTDGLDMGLAPLDPTRPSDR